MLPSKMVYAIKNSGTTEERYKARLTAGGHRDREKALLIHNSQNIRHASVRLLISVGATQGWRIWSKDADQAYTQCEDMSRVVVLVPAPEFGLPPGVFLRVRKFLYGLAESGDAWHQKLKKEITVTMKMRSSTSDQALYYKSTNAGLEGIAGTYVDDILLTGRDEFEGCAGQLDLAIKMKPADDIPLTFAGLTIDRREGQAVVVHQKEYIRRKLEALEIDCSYEEFRSCRHRVAWVSAARPDVMAATSLFRQVTSATFGVEDVKRINKVIKYLKLSNHVHLKYAPMDWD